MIFIQTAFFRDNPESIAKATIFSNTAMIVVSAANDRKMKNNVPQICPPGIELKIFGSVMNTRPGPESTGML